VLFRHLPYNATPAYLKAKTDAAFTLLREINSTVLDENKMTPREVKVLEQVCLTWNFEMKRQVFDNRVAE
jgi:hypothetical protein